MQSFRLHNPPKKPTPLKTHRHPISVFCFIPSPASLLPPAELNGVCWCRGSRVCSVQLSSAQLGCRCYKLGVWLLSEPDSSTQDVCTDGYYVIGYSQPWKEGWERAEGRTGKGVERRKGINVGRERKVKEMRERDEPAVEERIIKEKQKPSWAGKDGCTFTAADKDEEETERVT